jgi:hypothetical protein
MNIKKMIAVLTISLSLVVSVIGSSFAQDMKDWGRGGIGGGSLPAGTQGAILYHNGITWVALPPGTSGAPLITQGAGANPIWYVSTGGGGDTTYDGGTP